VKKLLKHHGNGLCGVSLQGSSDCPAPKWKWKWKRTMFTWWLMF